MREPELIAAVGIGAADLEQLVEAGLPHTVVDDAREFDPEAVRKWLLANGHAEAQYIQTAVELGTHFGVSAKTIQTWAHKGMPGLTEQGYDVAAITEWCQAMGLGRIACGDFDE